MSCATTLPLLKQGLLATAIALPALVAMATPLTAKSEATVSNHSSIQLGPRPYFLVNDMDEGTLKDKLNACASGPFAKTDFSIGHRGAALQFPEHTKESYEAAARMGAGILECDVTFTKDRQLVCRHSQCDLHATTDILLTDLASKCNASFIPADAKNGVEASAECCTSDITLAEFRSLRGKMDGFNPNATTVEAFLQGTEDFRTDLYSSPATLMTHKESIDLFKKLDVKYTPELKSPSVEMPFMGEYTLEMYAQQMIDEYKEADVRAENVWAQSFDLEVVKYWIDKEPRFGNQAVYLDDRDEDKSFNHTNPATWDPGMEQLYMMGVRILAPPMWMLLKDDGGTIAPSRYAEEAKAAGLHIITWTLERSGLLRNGGGFYYQTITNIVNNDGDIVTTLDVLAQKVGIIGIFSDWPATVTYYANCMDL